MRATALLRASRKSRRLLHPLHQARDVGLPKTRVRVSDRRHPRRGLQVLSHRPRRRRRRRYGAARRRRHGAASRLGSLSSGRSHRAPGGARIRARHAGSRRRSAPHRRPARHRRLPVAEVHVRLRRRCRRHDARERAAGEQPDTNDRSEVRPTLHRCSPFRRPSERTPTSGRASLVPSRRLKAGEASTG